MSKKKLIVHAGYTKTGSTSLQIFCRTNHDLLEKNNILYPVTCNPAINHHDIIIDPNKLSDLINELKMSKVHTGVVSAELLYQIYKPNIKQVIETLREHFEVKLLLYLRNPINWIQSIYAQEVAQWEHRFTGSMSDFIFVKKQDLDYKNIIELWEKIIGQENIIIRSYDYIIKESNIFNDFMDLLNIENKDKFIIPHKKHNPSLSHSATHLLKKINTLGLIKNKQIYIDFSAFLKEKSNDEDFFRFLSKEDYELIYINFYKKIEYVSKKYMTEKEEKYLCDFNYIEAHDDNSVDLSELANIITKIWRKSL